jgi:hypothetical protein
MTHLTVAAIPALLERFGIAVPTPHHREDATVWDLELDGVRRRGLRLSLIHDARPGGVVVVWAHLAPPLGDGLRKAYRRLLEWNDTYLFAKFGIAQDGRPVLSIEMRAEQVTESDLIEALARTVLIADRLLDETAAWIWIGGRVPADDGSPRRNQGLLRADPSLADRLEG